MTEIDDIIDAYHNKGKSISEIAGELGKDRKTEGKYVRKEGGFGILKLNFLRKGQLKIDHLTFAPCIVGEKPTTVEDTGNDGH